MSSNFLAKIALSNPAKENTPAVITTTTKVNNGYLIFRSVKNKAITETTAATNNPLIIPPARYPITIEASLIGETNNSSICLCIFALKKLPTTLPYELVITDIIIRPGAIYSIYGYPSISPMRLPIRVPKIIK